MNSVVDLTCIEGGKLLGVRSKEYTIDRGGVSISVYDMGTGTEISGVDMDMGKTSVSPEELLPSKHNANKKNIKTPLREVPNVEANITIDPKTGKAIASFK